MSALTKNKSSVNLCMSCYQMSWCNMGELDMGLYCTTDYWDISHNDILSKRKKLISFNHMKTTHESKGHVFDRRLHHLCDLLNT